ncbi:MAG: 7-cyano-7-deazaguanine synthase, partial [Muribaculaceae bacterium]|nr:7-cyano-7-deazaguanine synthase [Muribaculaceae bacterium]
MGIVNELGEKSVFLPAKEEELVFTVDEKQYPARRSSLIVLSGGMDSVTLMHEYKARIALAVTFDYGSNHNAREIECARWQCELLGIPHIVIP